MVPMPQQVRRSRVKIALQLRDVGWLSILCRALPLKVLTDAGIFPAGRLCAVHAQIFPHRVFSNTTLQAGIRSGTAVLRYQGNTGSSSSSSSQSFSVAPPAVQVSRSGNSMAAAARVAAPGPAPGPAAAIAALRAEAFDEDARVAILTVMKILRKAMQGDRRTIRLKCCPSSVWGNSKVP